jgi:PIN domain nuclease of toxin-antitoxin system
VRSPASVFEILIGVTTGEVSEEELASWVSTRIRRLDDLA